MNGIATAVRRDPAFKNSLWRLAPTTRSDQRACSFSDLFRGGYERLRR